MTRTIHEDERIEKQYQQAQRAHSLFAAIIFTAVDDAIDDNRKYKNKYGTKYIKQWALSPWGEMVLTCANIEPGE